MTDETLVAQINAAFRRLPSRACPDQRVSRMLAGFWASDPEAGRPPAKFRSASKSTCLKELARLAFQSNRVAELSVSADGADRRAWAAKRLRDTIDKMHEPTILALADAGFLGGDRLALREAAGRLACPGEQAFESQIRQLDFAADCASRAKIGPLKKPPSRHRPINLRVQVLARILAKEFQRLTGREPAITVAPDHLNSPATGLFVQLVKDVFAALNISASAEVTARAAIAEHRAGQ